MCSLGRFLGIVYDKNEGVVQLRPRRIATLALVVAAPFLALAGFATLRSLVRLQRASSALEHSDPQVRRKAAETLRHLFWKRPAARALAGALADPDPVVRNSAVQYFQKAGRSSKSLARRLREHLDHPQPEVRVDALAALVAGRQRGEAEREAALRLLQEPSAQVRWRTLRIVREMRRAPAEFVEQLRLRIQDEHPEVRGAAIDTVAAFEKEHARAIPDLVRALQDEERDVRVRAVKALGKIGSPAGSAVPRLAQMLREEAAHPRMLEALLTTLKEIGSASAAAIPQLLPLLRHPYSDVRADVAQALGAIGPPAAEALPALRELEQDRELCGAGCSSVAKAIAKIDRTGR